MSAQQNKQTAEDAYRAFGKQDAEGAMRDIDDSIAWTIGGDNALTGTHKGKQAVGELWGKYMSAGFRTGPHDFVAEGDKVVVLTTREVGGGAAEGADVLTFNDAGKLVTFESVGDTAAGTAMPPQAALNPSHIMQVGAGFWASKTVLSAVELELFTHLGGISMSGEELGERLGLHTRAVYDFLDTLVALRFLERDGDGRDGRYRNTAETAAFLDKQSPMYIGGILEMFNARLYRFWGDLTEALQTGKPQNEIKHTGKPMFEELYSDPARLEQFMGAMRGVSAGNFHALADKFDFSKYETVCDVGGATGQLCTILATHHPHLRCTSYDLPIVAPIAERAIAAAGQTDRVAVASGDFFADPLPPAEVITMGMILHDWNLDRKKHLISSVYDALPDGGAFIIVENLIDDARRENAFGLMMSLNMLIEFGDAFDFTGGDFDRWCREAGFQNIEILPLAGPASAGIAYK
jgi:ketosteroid isomerase-like protein